MTTEAEGSAVEHGGHHEPTLKTFFFERAIHIASMERALRWITITAVAGIVAAAVLVALRNMDVSSLPLTTESGVTSRIPSVAFWVAVGIFSAAWAYVLGGLLHAHRLVRVAALGVFTYGLWELWNAPYPLWTWRMAPSYVLLAIVWIVGLAALHEPPDERGDARRLRLRILPSLFVLILALELAFWWRARSFHDPRFYTLPFFHQLEFTSFALIPVLLMAGVDFAEWGDATAVRLTGLARQARPAWSLPLLALGSAGAVLAYFFATRDASALERNAPLGIALLVLAGSLAFAARRADGHVPYAAMFGSSLTLMGLILGFIYSVSGGGPGLAVYSHPGKLKFHLARPADWTPQEIGGNGLGLSMTVFFLPDNAKNRFFVVNVPKTLLSAVPDPRSIFFAGPVEATSKDGEWQQARIRWKGETTVTWQKDDAAGRWILAGAAFPKDFAGLEPEFEKVKESWEPTPAKPGSEAPGEGKYTVADRAIEGSTFAWIGLALAAAGSVVFTRRRKRPPWLAAAALFVFVAGAYWTLVQLPTFAYTVFGASSRDAWPQLTDASLDVAAAAVTVLAVAIPRLHRYLGALIGLVLGLFAVFWIDRAISTGIEAGRLSIVAAVLVLVALLWEVVMSGEAITNRHNRHFPRHTRVMVYLGYLLAVAAAVLFFSSIKTAKGSVEPLFESENFSDTGLLFLGVAFVVTMFFLRAMRASHRDG